MSASSARWGWLAATLAVLAGCLALLVPQQAASEQAASETRRAQAGYIDAGDEHTCAVLADRSLRCWGEGLAGRLGNGGDADVLSPAAAGPVPMPGAQGVRAVAAGDFHTCAILDDGSVRCWGFGANGRLGYGDTANVFTPAAAPPVQLGLGRTATAITAGASHTCAILDDGSVRCWGNGIAGRLGLGGQATIGDDETPAAAPPVDLGPGRRARAIAAGDFHTCAVLDDGSLLCWGFGLSGQLGYGGTGDVGDDETPAAAGPVPLGAGRTVRAVSGGTGHTCAILDDGSVRCWGFGANGRLGYGNESSIQAAASAPAVAIGAGRTATAVAAGDAHTCVILDDGAVRCWGFGGSGRLGYPGDPPPSIGDTETPAAAGPVSLGAGRTARAITAGFSHTCGLLDDGTARCWGFGADGRLGYGDEESVGDDEAPAAAGAVPLGGALPAAVADLTVTMSAGSALLAVGDRVVLGVTVANRGSDAASGVAVDVPAPAGLAYEAASASQGAFDGASGRWQVGGLAPGASAALSLTAGAHTAGTFVVAAEVVASSLLDPTSTPANGALEDDRAAVQLVVPSTQALPGPRLRPRGLVLSVRRVPRRGRAKRLVATGRLLLPRTRPAPRCAGRVTVRAAVGRRTLATRRVALRARRGVCRFSAQLRPARARSARVARVSARFLGTAQLRPRSSRTLRVRIR